MPPPASDTRSMHFWIAAVESVHPVGSAPASVTTARTCPEAPAALRLSAKTGKAKAAASDTMIKDVKSACWFMIWEKVEHLVFVFAGEVAQAEVARNPHYLTRIDSGCGLV